MAYASALTAPVQYVHHRRRHFLGRVDDWRGGGRYLSTVAAPFVWRCRNRGIIDSVSSRRSSNRTCGSASGSRTRSHAIALGRSCTHRDELNEPQRVVEVLVREATRPRVAHLVLSA